MRRFFERIASQQLNNPLTTGCVAATLLADSHLAGHASGLTDGAFILAILLSVGAAIEVMRVRP